ncbi:hypothetical protein [Allofournierella sp.]|uniref:hypothetical protein n=1 Tax=Allofournierella sp. TaxID=1940256 RepID=UPI003AB17473
MKLSAEVALLLKHCYNSLYDGRPTEKSHLSIRKENLYTGMGTFYRKAEYKTEESWKGVVGKEISYQGNDVEVYFEEGDFDQFLDKLSSINTVEYVHPVMEHAWGQRVVRFYDPDHHIIEVGENMKAVCKRFSDEGMTMEEISERMGIPLKAVKAYMR